MGPRASNKRRRQSGSPLPLKKRRKIQHYPIALAIDRQQVPTVGFTIEEEYRLHDLVARTELINLQIYKELMSADFMRNMMNLFVSSMKKNEKIKTNENDLERYLTSSRELYASQSNKVFDEFRVLKKKVAYRLHCNSWPALQCLELSSEFCLPQLYSAVNKELSSNIPGLKEACELTCNRGLGLKNYAIFDSPWAQSEEYEIFFEKTISDLSKLLKDDYKLCVIYTLLLISSTPPGSKRPCKEVSEIQGDMAQLMYRYLTSQMNKEEASQKAYSLVGHLNKLYRCGDIFMNHRIKID